MKGLATCARGWMLPIFQSPHQAHITRTSPFWCSARIPRMLDGRLGWHLQLVEEEVGVGRQAGQHPNDACDGAK